MEIIVSVVAILVVYSLLAGMPDIWHYFTNDGQSLVNTLKVNSEKLRKATTIHQPTLRAEMQRAFQGNQHTLTVWVHDVRSTDRGTDTVSVSSSLTVDEFYHVGCDFELPRRVGESLSKSQKVRIMGEVSSWSESDSDSFLGSWHIELTNVRLL